MTSVDNPILSALRAFAKSVKEKVAALAAGEPEDQLRSPFEVLIREFGAARGLTVVPKGESLLAGRIGKPDYAILVGGLLAGYVELKAPGVGANPDRFRGHDLHQWNRFKAIPNLLYTDGNEWTLYRSGERARPLVRVTGDIAAAGSSGVKSQDADALGPLLTDFLIWEPIIPGSAEKLAQFLAPICGMLRDDVADALKDDSSPLVQLASDWRQLLFPDASDEQFADAYAQTVTFALLLARSNGADTTDIHASVQALSAGHTLLSKALEVLTDPQAQSEISASLQLIQRVTKAIPEGPMSDGEHDPWLYFYEDFLAVYDEKLRKDAGAYYTPVQVVQAQVSLIDELLIEKLGKPLGFADAEVVTLDPAVGTGTYLLGVIDHALGRVEAEEGVGAVRGSGADLARNLYGFEKLVGPYAVSELRVSRALLDRGITLPRDGLRIYLTDTLESPHTQPPQVAWVLRAISDQHRRALRVKETVPVIVCLGNPPYDRTLAADGDNRSRTGGWVRHGDPGEEWQPILSQFLTPATEAGYGVQVHNLYNLYVYFWRWALWKVFEHTTSSGPGIVSFITASSYLDGNAFVGMREHMRRICDEIWVIDVGGEGRGTRRDENVFAIQTPVAIAVAARYRNADKDDPAKVHYARIEGDRDEKLERLASITTFADLEWADCSDGWQDKFRPPGVGDYFKMPLLTDLFPWQQSGVKVGRLWPIAPDRVTLDRRWDKLRASPKDERRGLFKDSRTGRQADNTPQRFPPADGRLPSILEVGAQDPMPETIRYAYRSFDRQFLIADPRLIDRHGPPLWRAYSGRQVYVTSSFSEPLGTGPALSCAAHISDLHHFCGRGAKDTIPLWRDPGAESPNLTPGLLKLISDVLGIDVSPTDFLAYVYGVLAHPAFTRRFAQELEKREVRVPLTKNSALFAEVRAVGEKLLWLHTYGERFIPRGHRSGVIPRGQARSTRGVSSDPDGYPDEYGYDPATETLTVGDGEFRPVAKAVWVFEVSGLKVVESWLRYRMKRGRRKHSSPLDDIHPERWTSEFTRELLRLLWILEATLAEYPEQERLLNAVLDGPVFAADELPPVPDTARKPPGETRAGELLAD